MGKAFLPVSESIEAGIRKTDIIFKMRAGGSFSKSLKTWSALPARLSPRDLVMGGISWAGLFENPWKPDSPCPSGFLPYGLFRGRVSCVGSWHFRVHSWCTFCEFWQIYSGTHSPLICALPIHPSSDPTLGKHWFFFYCLHCFDVSRMSYGWNHIVGNLFKLASVTWRYAFNFLPCLLTTW